MAGQVGGSVSDLMLELLEKGHTFSFFQAIRLLRLLHAPSEDAVGSPSEATDHIRIRPKLSLAFPAADVDRVDEGPSDTGAGQFMITANLLGLYGAASPLPTFYTEDLMDEAGDEESASRDFIDIINHRLYLLLFESWAKYRQCLQVVEQENSDHLLRLFALLGLGEEVLRRGVSDPHGLIRYIGLFTQFPRSALGLSALLHDALGGVSVSVIPCVERTAIIPRDQRVYLGASGGALGIDSYIGEQVPDRMGKFRIQVARLRREPFQALLPGGESAERIAFLARFFVPDPLEFDVELVLAEGEAQPTCLGRRDWSRLGLDTWIFSGGTPGEVSVRY